MKVLEMETIINQNLGFPVVCERESEEIVECNHDNPYK